MDPLVDAGLGILIVSLWYLVHAFFSFGTHCKAKNNSKNRRINTLGGDKAQFSENFLNFYTVLLQFFMTSYFKINCDWV